MSYFVRREDLMTGAVTRSGPFETEQEAMWALQNAADMDCEAEGAELIDIVALTE